jgi:hypothetical protein
MPEGAIYVGRPTRWGHPLSLAEIAQHEADADPTGPPIDVRAARAFAVDWYRVWLDMPEAAHLRKEIHDLAGHDLVCWCPLDQPCHADVLLELANGSLAARTPENT